MEQTRYQTTEHHRLPPSPGVYTFYNKEGALLYVGKANNLKKRVASYFNKQKNHLIKTRKMVGNIASIGCVVVNEEYDALILENNLIKKHQPRYNVLLKDGKTFPYLCLTNERFPRLIVTRQKHPSFGEYFGPFTSTTHLARVEELIRYLFPLRICQYNLSQENIRKKKFKVCLAYHIGNCMGPCAGLQDETSYNNIIEQVKHILKGNFQLIKKLLKEEMLAQAGAHNFKKAQAYKEKIAAITNYQARSLLIHPRFGDFDIIVLLKQAQEAFISYFYVEKGMLIFAQTFTIEKKLDEQDTDLLSRALLHFREKSKSNATTILTNHAISTLPSKAKALIPQIGDRRKLVDLAMKNAFLAQKKHQNKKVKKLTGNHATLQLLQQDLQLKQLPTHIECFDNSNLQGTHPVAGMVCFKNGRPAKRDYRLFHIKTVVGPDDFASMQEVVKRRYARLAKDGLPLPNLIVIDGGKGQLGMAVKALKEVGVYDEVDIIAIAKKLETIFKPNDPLPIFMPKKSPGLKMIQRIRNAVHDFALRFHKKTRQSSALRSELEDIPGFGPQTIRTLFQKFGSVKNMLNASQTALKVAIGAQKANAFHAHFQGSH